jgi:GntR family transcriptional regulator / MocR family aminotransferase
MPGLRVGFLIANGPVYDSLVKYKRVNDLATSSLIQRALEDYVTVGRYQAHLRRSSGIFHKRRNAMLVAIERHLPIEIQIDPPQGGLFLWMKLPQNLSADALLPLAISEGVDFMPGSSFFLDEADGLNWLRLNFVVHNEEKIEDGIKRLGWAVKRLKSLS